MEDGDHVIAYASKTLQGAELNYSHTDGELLAIVWAVKLFRPYLYGVPFTIVTDHKALKWLLTTRNLSGKLARYAIELQEYDFNIQHRAGSLHGNVDCLSRLRLLPPAMEIEEKLPPVEMEILIPENLKKKEKPPPTDKIEDDNVYYHHNKENLPPTTAKYEENNTYCRFTMTMSEENLPPIEDEKEESNMYCRFTMNLNLENMMPAYKRTHGELPRNQHQQPATQNEETTIRRLNI